MPKINREELSTIIVLFPDKIEQSRIVSYLNENSAAIERLSDKINSEITLLHEYRTRLISDVVIGKLDVRGVTVPEFESVEEAAAEDEAQDEDEPTDAEEE